MGSRLALLGCHDPYEGPWTRAKGNETGLEIAYLAEGEAVELELSGAHGLRSYTFSEVGCFTIPRTKFTRYRVCKRHLRIVEKPFPTIVRILLDGVT